MRYEEGDKIKISVIIPVYNCESYLEKCIRSVLDQTLQETEIICIDDGSTDQSVRILENLEKKESRISVLRQKNKGAGSARNRGIRAAKGKYVAFLDADDYYVDRDALERMYCACEEEGVSVCGSRRMELDGEQEKEGALFSGMFEDGKDKRICLYREYQIDYDYQNFLFERALLQKNEIEFPLYRRFQDPPFLVQALFVAERFAVVDTRLYCYRLPDVVFRFNESKTVDLLRGLNENLTFAAEHQLDRLFERTQERLEYEYAYLICRNISGENTEILGLLWKANQIVCDKRNCDYMIRPLKMLLCGARKNIEQYARNLADIIKKQEVISIYGAGKVAGKMLDFLEKEQLLDKVRAMIVSDRKENAERIGNIPVISIDQYQKDGGLILVALGAISQGQIKRTLERREIENYMLVDDIFLKSL